MSENTKTMLLVGTCLVAIFGIVMTNAPYMGKVKKEDFYDCKAEREQIFECLGNLAEARDGLGKAITSATIFRDALHDAQKVCRDEQMKKEGV